MKKTVVLMSMILIVAAGAVAQSQINETDSGLKYIDHQVGDGDEAVEGKTVRSSLHRMALCRRQTGGNVRELHGP